MRCPGRAAQAPPPSRGVADARFEHCPDRRERLGQGREQAQVDVAFAGAVKVAAARGEQFEFERRLGVARGIGADGNGDGNIDNADYQLWQGNFGRTLTGAAAGSGVNAVPEPSAGSLFVLVSYSLLIFHLRSLRIGNKHFRYFCRTSISPIRPTRHSREFGKSLVVSRQRGFALFA